MGNPPPLKKMLTPSQPHGRTTLVKTISPFRHAAGDKNTNIITGKQNINIITNKENTNITTSKENINIITGKEIKI